MEGISSDERYFEGLLTVQMKDKQGEVTIVDELYKVLPVWIDRGAPISDTHSNRIVGKGINYSRTTVKNDEGHELPAIKITGKIFKNYELDNVIWNKIKNNEYKGLSFGGATRSARSPIKMKDGTTAYALSDLEHYEVAVCADPAVPMAIITDFNQIAKANFNSSVRDDGKMVIQCDNMGCYVNKIGGGGIGGGDLLTVMEGDKPENYNAVENGKKRGRPIDKTEPTGLTDKQLKLWREIQEDVKEDSDNQYYTKVAGDYCPNCGKGKKEMGDMVSMGGACPNCGHGFKEKFMEKKEMLDATLGNKKEKRPTQPESDMRETETSGYTPDLEKAIEIINKAGYKVDTEDRNNGTGINDVEREIPEKKLPIKGSLSQELPTQIQQADLNESQTFEQKVQALMAEGKSRESAEKIVGSFVHKVEASSGSGGAGIGDSNNSNGGTLTTQTGGANNPIHNSKCECDKCRSKGLDISNTGSGGTTEGAFNQNPPNAQRLNNKADDEEDEETTDIVEEEEERPEWDWLMNRHKSKATREVNKIHALMKLNKLKTQLGSTVGENENTGSSGIDLDTEDENEAEHGFEGEHNNNVVQNQAINRRVRMNRNRDDVNRITDKSTFKKPPEKHRKRVTVEDIISHGKKEREEAEKRVRELKIGALEKALSELNKIKTELGSVIGRPEEQSTDPMEKYEDNKDFFSLNYEDDEEGGHERQGDLDPKAGEGIDETLEKSLTELKKLQTSGGLGSRGLGAGHTYTQGQQESTQVTLVQPRPEDDRVQSKRTTQEPKVVKKIRANRGVGAFGSDLPDKDKTPAVADENTVFMDHNGNPHKTQAEADAVPARKRMNRRTSRAARNAYRANPNQTIGDRLKE